jgi:hypothetical protein
VSAPFNSSQFEKGPNRAMPRVRVRTSRLSPTQVDYKVEQIRKISAQDPRGIEHDPVVHPFQGRYHISDGHHRVAAAMMRGDTAVTVKRAPPDQADVADPGREHLGARSFIAEFRQHPTAPLPEPVASHVPPAERHAAMWRKLMFPEAMIDNLGPVWDVSGS